MNIEHDALVQQFLAKYMPRGDNDLGRPLTAAEIQHLEAELSKTGAVMSPVELPDDQRQNLRGLRAANLPVLMGETAEALKACPDIAAGLGTSAELLAMLGDQDSAASALGTALSILYNGLDTAWLMCTEEAESMLDDVDAKVKLAIGPFSTLDKPQRSTIESVFTEALTTRAQAWQRVTERARSNQAQVAPQKDAVDQAQKQAESARLVRQLIEAALAKP